MGNDEAAFQTNPATHSLTHLFTCMFVGLVCPAFVVQLKIKKRYKKNAVTQVRIVNVGQQLLQV